jgi:hypothetical protein
MNGFTIYEMLFQIMPFIALMRIYEIFLKFRFNLVKVCIFKLNDIIYDCHYSYSKLYNFGAYIISNEYSVSI